MMLTPLQKLSKNVEDLGKLIVAKALKSCPKLKKSPNLVTLVSGQFLQKCNSRPELTEQMKFQVEIIYGPEENNL